MPIKLKAPHTRRLGHGRADVDHAMVMIIGLNILPASRRMIITLEYGDVVDGAWVGGGDIHKVRIENRPARKQGGEVLGDLDPAGDFVIRADQKEDPKAVKQWVEVEVEPAVLAFDDMRADFAIRRRHVGESGYDAVSEYLYTWLLDQKYYEGSIA